MAVSTLDQLTEAVKRGETKAFLKAAFTSEGAGTFHSLWAVAGNPAAGAAAGSINGVVPTDATTGAFAFVNAAGTDNNYIGSMTASSTVAGTLVLYDRLWHSSGMSGTQTVSTGITPTALTRYTTGAGVEMWGEIYTAIGATGATLTVQYCVDPATECLTRRGWTTYRDLAEGDDILAFDVATYSTRWEPIREVFRNEHYVGDMISFEGREFSALTTPDHRWPMMVRGRGGNANRLVVRTSEDLPHDGWLLRGADHEAPAEPIYTDAFVRLAAWYFTEGTLRDDGKGVVISQSKEHNPDNVTAIREDLWALGAQDSTGAPIIRNGQPRHGPRGNQRRVGLWYSERADAADVVRWLITGTDVDRMTSVVAGKDKVPTMDFMCSLTQRQLDEFVEVCLRADGDPRKRIFYQHHVGRMDAFVTAAVLTGWGVSTSAAGTTCALRSSHGQGAGRASLGKLQRRRVHYEGPIWCPVTTSGHWVARRRGKVFITGNTNQSGTTAQSATYAHPANAESVGQMFPFVLASGDTGVRAPTNYIWSVSTGSAGNFGLTLMKRIVTLPLAILNKPESFDAISCAVREVVDDACLAFMVQCSATGMGIISGELTLAKG